MTNEELQSIISAVLSAIRTNSALISDLTEVTTLPGEAYLELSGGRRIKGTTLKSILQQAIMDDAVSPLVATEKGLRETADTALRALIETVKKMCEELDKNKFNNTDVVQAKGDSTTQVMSQNAVSTEISFLKQAIETISVSGGRQGKSELSIAFTNEKGLITFIPIKVASETAAGIITADDYKMLKEHNASLKVLDNERLSGFIASSDPDGVTLSLARKGGLLPLTVKLPIAGEEAHFGERIAGVMSGKQAKDLADVTSKCFPLEFIDEGDNTGVFEVGTNVQAAIAFSIMKQGENVTEQCEITANGLNIEIDDEGVAQLTSHDWITYNQTFRVVITFGDETIEKTYEYKFMNYVFGFSFDEAVTEDPKELVGSGCSGYWLSNDYELGPTRLRPGEGYIFAVPNYSTLIVRDESGAEITDCEFGYMDVEYLESVGKRTYAYIIVPASTKSWTFKITNN